MSGKAGMGFIGAGGFITAHHLATANAGELIEVRAIADINPQILENHRASLKTGYVTANYRGLLADDRLDIIVIGTRQDLHARLIIECLDAGKWVFCEKPMANTVEESRNVLEAEKRNPGRLAIGFNRRFAPAYRQARELMRRARRPWFINYRMMNQSTHVFDGYYQREPRILYEGCHLLDLARWFFESDPAEIYMTGDRRANNCCILSFADGSQFQLLCGSVGATSFRKENMEVFGQDKTICINDFTDMRVRGFPGEYDRLFAPYRGEHAAEVLKYGFEFYEMYQAHCRDEYVMPQFKVDWARYGIANVMPRRPIPLPFDLKDFGRQNRELKGFCPNKGWYESLEHFAECFLSGGKPENASGIDGAKATGPALRLLESLETRRPIRFPESPENSINPEIMETANAL